MTIGKIAPALIGALALLSPLALGACAAGGDTVGPDPVTPTERFAIEVKTRPRELRLAVHETGASPTQARALGAYAADWREAEGGAITIRTPSRGADPAAAYRTANDARDILAADGVALAAVQITGYEPTAGEAAVVVLTYERYVAESPRCGAWEDLTATSANREYVNFGCSITANIAAEIADPRDLLSPRPMTPPDAARRQAVLDAYRKGALKESTVSISSAVQ
ncbi:MAG: CpaD family pilus assembly protein [Caulobacteraceae bacterium]